MNLSPAKPFRARRGLSLIVSVLAVMFLLVACGGGDSESEPTAADDAAQETETAAGESEAEASGKLEPLSDGFPDRRITLWNAFEPGHTDDLFNTVVADVGRDISSVPLVTESHPSGSRLQYGLVDFLNGQAGAQEGYHVFAISYFGGSLRPFTVEALADAELADIQPINMMVEAPFVFVAPKDSQFESLEDVEVYAKENPGELTAVGSGTGSGLHSTLLVWANQAGVEVRFIPTDGSGESKNTLLGGGAQLGVLTFEPGMEKELKVLAVTGDEAPSTMPDAPTTTDLGYTIPAGSFRGFGTLPDVPQEHIEWLNDLFKRVAEDPAFAEQQEGLEIVYRGPDEAEKMRQQIVDTFIPVLEEAGLTHDQG